MPPLKPWRVDVPRTRIDDANTNNKSYIKILTGATSPPAGCERSGRSFFGLAICRGGFAADGAVATLERNTHSNSDLRSPKKHFRHQPSVLGLRSLIELGWDPRRNTGRRGRFRHR